MNVSGAQARWWQLPAMHWRAQRTLHARCSASTASATPPTSSAWRSRSRTRASRSSPSRSTRPTARRVRELSGQDLVPVLVDGDEVDHRLDAHPAPPRAALPRSAAVPRRSRRARRGRGVPRLVQPRLEARAEPDRRRARATARATARTSSAGARGCSAGSTCSRACSTGREHLFGAFGAADCAAWPFLRYAVAIEPDDDELFHRVLHERMTLEPRHREPARLDRARGRARRRRSTL